MKTRRWTLESAAEFVAEIQPQAWKYGYCISMGGGVVNKGHSDNDLDLVAHSRSDTECKPSDLVFYIFEHCMTRCLEHSQVSDHVVVGMVLPDDKMIELCFPYHTYDTEIPIIQTPRLRKGLII